MGKKKEKIIQFCRIIAWEKMKVKKFYNKKMKSNNDEIFYQRVQCLFPSIGFKERKFLRELRFNLRGNAWQDFIDRISNDKKDKNDKN